MSAWSSVWGQNLCLLGVWRTRGGGRVRVEAACVRGWAGDRLDIRVCARCGHPEDCHLEEEDNAYCVSSGVACGCTDFRPDQLCWTAEGQSLTDGGLDLVERVQTAVAAPGRAATRSDEAGRY